MKLFIYIAILFSGIIFYEKEQLPHNPPKHLELQLNWEGLGKSEPIFQFKNPDTLINHQMYLLSSEEGLPLLYYADITTPVCIEGLCKPVYIEMYWDLFGKYIGYGEYPDEILSKFDHEDFESEDYLKLHELLLDEHSLLGRRRLSALYDISKSRKLTVKFKGIEVDAVSGATKKEIKTAIVDGALYSCYTLWHLAYGNAVVEIKKRLPEIYSDQLEDHFITSGHDVYHMYALKNMTESNIREKITQIVPVIKNGKPLTRSYILKKMPNDLYRNELLINEIFGHISKLDFNARTLVIDHLKYSTPTAALALSGQVADMSKNQLKSFLNIVSADTSFQIEDVLKSLHVAVTEDDLTFSIWLIIRNYNCCIVNNFIQSSHLIFDFSLEQLIINPDNTKDADILPSAFFSFQIIF